MARARVRGNKTHVPGISTPVDGVTSTYGTLVITSHPGNESAWMFACSLVSFWTGRVLVEESNFDVFSSSLVWSPFFVVVPAGLCRSC